MEAKFQNLDHRWKVAYLSVFNRIYFGECKQELYNLVPLSPFPHRNWYTILLRFVFLMPTAKIWDTLLASVFPENYNGSHSRQRIRAFFRINSYRCRLTLDEIVTKRLCLFYIKKAPMGHNNYKNRQTRRDKTGTCRQSKRNTNKHNGLTQIDMPKDRHLFLCLLTFLFTIHRNQKKI